MNAPGWYPDPSGRFEFRWFDGQAWSAAVSRGGVQSTDAVGAGPAVPARQALPSLPHVAPVPRPGSSSIDALVEVIQPRRSNTPVLVGVGLGVLAVGVAAVLVFAAGGSESGQSTAAAPATQAITISTDATTPETAAPVGEVSGAPGDETSRPVEVVGEPLPTLDSPASDPALGTPAPVLHGFAFDGSPITIGEAGCGPVLVVFLAHWCPHCNAEIPRLLEWQQSGAMPAGLQVVAIATAVSEGAPNFPPRQWLETKGWNWPVMIDQSQGAQSAGVAATAYGASGWPYLVLVGDDGLVKARYAGEIEVSDLQALVEAGLAG
jgi:thiol-disulfide isomerase/thioredoxin